MAHTRKAEMIEGVQNIINYVFQDASALWEALQAPGSVPYATDGRDFSNGNKRLALVGDAILKVGLLEEWYFTAANICTGNHIVATEGSNMKLAMTGRSHGLDGFVNNNPSQGNTVSDGTMAQTVEAILGAVWLDSQNLATVRGVMETIGLA